MQRYIYAKDKKSAKTMLGTLILDCDTVWDIQNIFCLRHLQYAIIITEINPTSDKSIAELRAYTIKDIVNACGCLYFDSLDALMTRVEQYNMEMNKKGKGGQ